MGRMTSFKDFRCEFAPENDDEHELIVKALKEGRWAFDTKGRIGLSSAMRTIEFVKEVGAKNAALTAYRMIQRYIGQKEPHDYQEGNVVFIYSDPQYYCKVMFMLLAGKNGKPQETLVIDIHRSIYSAGYR